MANKVNVDLDMNVEGYVQGIDQATQSTEKYETETRKVADAQVNLMKELKAARKEAQNLATGYAKLDAEAKNSAFGKEMARQLNEASEQAAYFINLQGDIKDGLNTLSSETATLDILTTGFAAIGGVASASAGAIALFTGNEEDAQRAVVMFTTAQSVLNTITATYNGIKKIQNVLLVKGSASTTLNTAVTNTNTVATKAATTAQAAFNKVAMANPYVLLAVAILTVVSALGAFIAWSGKAEAQEKLETKATEEAKAAKEAYYNSYNSKLGETMGNYTKLQAEWKNLKSEGEKNQWIKDNEQAFHDLGFEINNTADAENFFVSNEQAVIDSFDARARAAAYAAQQIEVYNQALKGTPKAGEKISVTEASKYGIDVKKREQDTHWFSDNEITVTKEDEKKIRDIRMNEAKQTSKELAQERVKAEEDASKKAAEAGVKTYNKTKAKLSKGGKTDKNTTKVDYDKGSLEDLQKQLSKWQDLLKKKKLNPIDTKKAKEEIERLKKEIESKEIELGFKTPDPKKIPYTEAWYKDQISKLEQQKQALPLDAYIDRQQLQDQIDSMNLKLKLETEGAVVTGSKDLYKAFNEKPKSLDEYNNAISALQKHLQEVDWSTMGEDGGKTFEQYIERIQELKAELEPLKENLEDAMLTPLEKAQKKMKETSETISSVGNALQAAGDLFSALGEATDDEGLKVMGIVAKAVATVALSFAQALTTCKTWVDWLAFGVTGLATMVTMISQIKSATAGGYAQGGIIPGSSYSGDRLTARVNSGEMILNQRQQKNLFNMLDQGAMPSANGTNVTVTGVVRGTDLMLVQKNTANVMKRAGNSIKF